MDIKEIIKGNTVNFSFYRAGNMYYTVNSTQGLFRFPVPISDVGDATLEKEDKAILFMRYIRKAIENKEFEKII